MNKTSNQTISIDPTRVTIILLSLVGTFIAIKQVWSSGINWLDISVLVVMYSLAAIGADVGLHRYYGHRSFKTSRAIQVVLGILGLMGAGGGFVYWVVQHPDHHKYSDVEGDMHSPHLHGSGFVNWLQGLFYSYIGWSFHVENIGRGETSAAICSTLLKDPLLVKIGDLQLLWIFLGAVVPAVVEGIITFSWSGVYHGFVWGGLLRFFLLQHIAGSVNSICHFYGTRPYKTNGLSTNNALLAIPSFGESWHNNHHAFPNSAYFGLEWWQIDFGNYVIWGLKKLGLVWDVNIPTKKVKDSKRTNRQLINGRTYV